MKKESFGRPFGSASLAGVVFLCIALSGFIGCEDDPLLSEENKITAFKIGNTLAAINEETQTIDITLPVTDNLAALKPEVTVSANASVSPESGTEVNITYPVSYTVTAENGVTRTYRVTAAKETAAVSLTAIQIQALPARTVYATGESFDPAGLIVVGVYSDGSVREETAYTLDPAPVSTAAAGPQTVTVSAGGKTATFTVSVRDASLESIEVTTLKSAYAYEEDLDPAGIVVTGFYSDGSTKIEEAASYTVSGYDPEKSGYQTLLVTLNGKTATFQVVVVTLDSFQINLLKSQYAYGEPFEPAGIIIRGYYSDGSSKIEEAASYTVSGYDPEKPGNQTLLVTLKGKTSTFQVTVGSKPEERDISVTIGLPNTNKEPEIFGIPEGGIKLSSSQKGLPDKIVISAAATSSVYSSIKWYVDGVCKDNNNIITISAGEYTLKIPHYITFVGTKGEVEYSRTITFTVEQ